MSVTLSLLLVLGCAHHAPPPAEVATEGLLGLRFQALTEGLVITDVVPGMGAMQAGVVVGDRVVRVDGVVPGADPRGQLVGPTGTEVALTLLGPLGGPERVLRVARGQPQERPEMQPKPEVVAEFERALDRGRPEAAAEAAEALVEASFGGWPALRAIAKPMRSAALVNPEAAAAAARVFAARCPDDWDVQFIAAEALFRVEDYAAAAKGFAAVEQNRPSDVALEGARGDLGGDPIGRLFLARSLAALHRAEEATAILTSLSATRVITGPLADLGLAPAPHATETWRALRAPLPPLHVDLLDGTAWRSEDHLGRPVLLSFWASWCGPCMEELPHLQALWEARRALGFEVLAISVDDLQDRAEVDRTVQRLGLNFPVAHAPALVDRFDIGPIPALRLIDRGGAVRYAATGYSEDSLTRLSAQVDAALGERPGDQSALGEVWAPAGVARLRAFVPVSGARAVAAEADGVVLGVSGGAPVRLESPEDLAVVGPPVLGTGDADRVAWLGGAITAERGKPWLRAWNEEGGARWFLTTPSSVSDLVVNDGCLWVATQDEILVFDDTGALLTRQSGGADDLAAAVGGVWAVDGKVRRWLHRSGTSVVAEDKGAARDSAVVGAGGEVGNRVAAALVAGHFGPDGALRVVATRDDGLVVGLDGQGIARFTLNLSGIPQLAAWDPDGDGQDALLVAVPDQGLAWVDLRLP